MKLILISLLLFSKIANAAFDENGTRYMMPADFYTKLIMLFPNGRNNCAFFFDGGALYGAINPVNGIAKSTTPDSNFISSYSQCGSSIISSELTMVSGAAAPSPPVEGDLSSPETLAKDSAKRIYGPLLKALTKNVEQIPEVLYLATTTLPKQTLLDHTVYLIHYMLGPDEVIKEYGKVSGAGELAQIYINQFSANSISDFTTKVLSVLLIRDEFLTY